MSDARGTHRALFVIVSLWGHRCSLMAIRPSRC
jgi:hypothetical protein